MKKEVTAIIINGKEFNDNTPKDEIYEAIIFHLLGDYTLSEIEDLVDLYYKK